MPITLKSSQIIFNEIPRKINSRLGRKPRLEGTQNGLTEAFQKHSQSILQGSLPLAALVTLFINHKPQTSRDKKLLSKTQILEAPPICQTINEDQPLFLEQQKNILNFFPKPLPKNFSALKAHIEKYPEHQREEFKNHLLDILTPKERIFFYLLLGYTPPENPILRNYLLNNKSVNYSKIDFSQHARKTPEISALMGIPYMEGYNHRTKIQTLLKCTLEELEKKAQNSPRRIPAFARLEENEQKKAIQAICAILKTPRQNAVFYLKYGIVPDEFAKENLEKYHELEFSTIPRNNSEIATMLDIKQGNLSKLLKKIAIIADSPVEELQKKAKDVKQPYLLVLNNVKRVLANLDETEQKTALEQIFNSLDSGATRSIFCLAYGIVPPNEAETSAYVARKSQKNENEIQFSDTPCSIEEISKKTEYANSFIKKKLRKIRNFFCSENFENLIKQSKENDVVQTEFDKFNSRERKSAVNFILPLLSPREKILFCWTKGVIPQKEKLDELFAGSKADYHNIEFSRTPRKLASLTRHLNLTRQRLSQIYKESDIERLCHLSLYELKMEFLLHPPKKSK